MKEKPLSFKNWCDLNGYAWIGSGRNNFNKRAEQYEEYLRGIGHLKEKTNEEARE